MPVWVPSARASRWKAEDPNSTEASVVGWLGQQHPAKKLPANERHTMVCAPQALTRCIAQDQKLFGWLKAMYAGWQHINVRRHPLVCAHRRLPSPHDCY